MGLVRKILGLFQIAYSVYVKDITSSKILHSGSKAQGKGDSGNHVL